MLCLNSLHVKWSLNFEDEIFLRGVECNIPLVSIGISPVDRARGIKFKENKLMENIS
jgi:hypothetical protein